MRLIYGVWMSNQYVRIWIVTILGLWIRTRDEDPVLAKNRIRGSAPKTKGDV